MKDKILFDAVSSKLLKLWPKGFTSEQISAFVNAMHCAEASKIIAAIDKYYEGPKAKFAPKPWDIKQLIGDSNVQQEVSTLRTYPLAEILRRQDPKAAGKPDCYVLWCYHRGLWRKGRAIILANRHPKAPDEQETARIDLALQANTLRFSRELETQLIVHGYDPDHCGSVAGWLDADPDQPGDGLRDVVQMLERDGLQRNQVEAQPQHQPEFT